jgi:hypothetical protein
MTRTLASLIALAACGGRAPAPTGPDPAKTAALGGVVADRGSRETLSFATVVAAPASDDDPAAATTATTDGNGRFRMAGLAPGAYDVHVYYADAAVRWRQLHLAAGDDVALAIEINAAPGGAPAEMTTATGGGTTVSSGAHGHGRITGRIVDEVNGEPVEGATISATLGARTTGARIAIADEGGYFRLAGLPAGSYRLSVYYRLVAYGDLELQINGIDVSAGKATDVPIRVGATPH